MTTIPEQWAERANYDLDTARAMLKSERYIYVLFCCQQAVEKMLKAVIASMGETPPRLHNLIRLVEHAKLETEKDRLSYLGVLSSYYIQTRYPEDTEKLSTRTSAALAQETLDRTEEIVKWLSSLIR